VHHNRILGRRGVLRHVAACNGTLEKSTTNAVLNLEGSGGEARRSHGWCRNYHYRRVKTQKVFHSSQPRAKQVAGTPSLSRGTSRHRAAVKNPEAKAKRAGLSAFSQDNTANLILDNLRRLKAFLSSPQEFEGVCRVQPPNQ